MSVTRSSLRIEIQQRLGDSNAQIWAGDELNRYIQEGYDDLTMRTGCLIGLALAPDYAASFNYTQDWELPYVLALAGYADGPMQFTSSFERDYVDNAPGPANHTEAWEQNNGYTLQTEISALVDLPDDLDEIERATWNTKRLEPTRSRDFESVDSRYELNKGIVERYVQDKDGLRRLRKWRVPSAPYIPYAFDSLTDGFTYTSAFETTYIPAGWEVTGPIQFTGGDDALYAASGSVGPGTHNYRWEALDGWAIEKLLADDGFGIIRDLTGISTATVNSDGFGDMVQVDGIEIFEPFGIIGPIYTENLNVRIEYRRRGATLSDTQDFEIPDRYTVYVRHFALARALEREGPGQELELATHFQSRYEAGVQRMLKRKEAMVFQRDFIMGGGGKSVIGRKEPRVTYPWQYGSVVR